MPTSTESRYVLPVGEMTWALNAPVKTEFTWEYDKARSDLLALYEKGKRQQWNAADRIDWKQDLDPENPMELPDETVDAPRHRRCGTGCRPSRSPITAAIRRRSQISQFMHGEQGALICAAKIVQQVQGIDAKFYAATQVVDEARHVEAYARLLHDKFDIVFPINKSLQALIGDVIERQEWDYTYLGMQVVIEGLALAAFQGIRDNARNRLAAQVNAYVMQDEARHVAFGRLALREYYPQLTDAERDRREEFLVEACYLMRDRLSRPTLGGGRARCESLLAAHENALAR